MTGKTRKEELAEIFADVDAGERVLVDRLIDEVIFLEGTMADLKKKPFIQEHPRRPGVIRTTPAAKLYKESSQSYMNAVRILLNILRKTETQAADELMKKLEEFA